MVSGACISGSVSHTASSGTGRARPGKGAAAAAATTSASAYRMDSGSTVARHSDGLEIQGDVAPSSQPAASNMIKKGRRTVCPDKANLGLRPFSLKVLDMVAHKGRTTYNKVPKHKRTAAGCDYVNDEEMEGTRDFTVKQRKKMKTTNPSEAHTDQRSHKRKHTHFDAKELVEQSTRKMKKSKKKTEAHQSTKNNQNVALEENTSLNDGSHGCKRNRGISVKSLRNTSSGTKNVEEGTSGPKDPSSLMQSHGDTKELAEQSTKRRKGKKKKDESSSKMKVHSDLLVSKKVPKNRSEETERNKDCIISQTLVLGKGKKASSGKTVTIDYTGKLQDGTVFGHTTGNRHLVFKLGDGKVIEGVDVGVVGMRVGERRKLTVPPSLGFGDKKMDNIPVNSTLEIYLDLIRVAD